MNLFPDTSLVGKCFHSVGGELSEITWQGKVVGKPEHGWYLVQLFSWISGEPTNQQLVAFEEMGRWLFYDDLDQMKHSAEDGPAKRLLAAHVRRELKQRKSNPA